jgi:hypothetical protein
MLLLFQAFSFVYALLDNPVVYEVRLRLLQDHYQFLEEYEVLIIFELLYVEFQWMVELPIHERDELITVVLFYVQ